MNFSKILAIFAITWGLAACGGESTGQSGSNGDQAVAAGETELFISLTDAEGDFLSYEVAVNSITLTRANGSVVHALPHATRVDFARYVELSELLTLQTVPAGRYNSASLTLDFSDAVITVQGETGEAFSAKAVDIDGQALAELEVEIQFGDRDGFVLLPGRPAHLSLDFDLDASNTIQIDTEIIGQLAHVVVDPMLIADAVLEDPKPFRSRGLLKNVNLTRQLFEIDLRPFRIRDHAFGRFNVYVDSETLYEIDGELFDDDGFEMLAQLDANAPIVAFGEWDRSSHTFTADEVRAGSSVAWGQADLVRATVIARDANRLTVRGASIEFSEGQFTFNDSIVVELGPETRVVKLRDSSAGLEDISVGSAIYVSGEMLDEGTMDASTGWVRIGASSIAGSVVSVSPLALDLEFINGRRTQAYDFSGTGVSTDNDADARYYEIDTATLQLGLVESGDPLRAKGWVSDFGSAPEDFEAFSLRNAATVKGHFLISYGVDGAATAINTLSEAGIGFDLSEAGARHHMIFAGIPIDLNTLQAGVPLLAPMGLRGIYVMNSGSRIVVSTTYTRFVELLEQELQDGLRVVRVDAHGFLNREDNRFGSSRIRVRLVEPSSE